MAYIPIIITLLGAIIVFKSSFSALEKQLKERESIRQEHMAELERTYHMAMSALIAALDVRDHQARGHSQRVVGYALAIGDRLGLTLAQKRELAFGGYLHDLGKIALDDELLHKETSLSDEEWNRMRRHPLLGHDILRDVDFLLGGASDVVLYHHEKYNGSGYPTGLSGADIPLLARVFSVADAFDAMVSDRPYRRAMSYQQARSEIEDKMDSQFCPICARAFLSLTIDELENVRRAVEEGRRENLWEDVKLNPGSESGMLRRQ